MADTGKVKEDGKNKKKPLKIACTNTDCKNGLHYFGPSGRASAKSTHPPGKCIDCGKEFVDWQRVGKNRQSDESYKLEMLRQEWIRHHYWTHYVPDQREVNYARRKGTIGLEARARQVLTGSVFKTTGHINDIQTPYSGTIAAAQHATATCCRKCAHYWHGVPLGQAPTLQQTNYLVGWIMKFLKEKYPNLSTTGEKVPPIRSK